MRALLAIVLAAVGVSPALATPDCTVPRGGPGLNFGFELQIGKMSEQERAQFYEQQLNARGIRAQQTRFWSGCIQTFVVENGHVSMRFYDPYTLDEIPVD